MGLKFWRKANSKARRGPKPPNATPSPLQQGLVTLPTAVNTHAQAATLLFTVEILAVITSYLSSIWCSRLFLIGNKTLCRRLTCGGITLIRHIARKKKSSHWPGLLLAQVSAHLQSYHGYSGGCSSRDYSLAPLYAAGVSLRTLSISFLAMSAKFESIPSFKRVFPNLTSLSLKTVARNACGFGHYMWRNTSQFPPGLVKLSIPLPCYNIYHFLPLTSLGHLQELDFAFPRTSWRCNVSDVSKDLHDWNMLMLPLKSLKKLSMGSLQAQAHELHPILAALPQSLKELRIRIYALESATLGILPQSLLKLRIDARDLSNSCFSLKKKVRFDGPTSSLSRFPICLTHILIKAKNWVDLLPLNTGAPNWSKSIPPNAIEFIVECPIMQLYSPLELSGLDLCSLPASLTRLQVLHEVSIQGTPPPLLHPVLPNWWFLIHHLREMCLDTIDGSLLSTLTQLEVLEVKQGFTDVLPANWLPLTRLKVLTMGIDYKLFYPSAWMRSDEMVAALPRSLEVLATRDLSGCNLPPQLKHLYLQSAMSFDPDNLQAGPNSLETLDVQYGANFGCSSASFASLPRNIRKLRLTSLRLRSSNLVHLPTCLEELCLSPADRLPILGVTKTAYLPKRLKQVKSTPKYLKASQLLQQAPSFSECHDPMYWAQNAHAEVYHHWNPDCKYWF